VEDTNITIKGLRVEIIREKQLSTKDITPLPIKAGRILSPWHEITLYRSEERLKDGIRSYDSSCASKSIEDYVLVIMTARDGYYEQSVLATAKGIAAMSGKEPTDAEIEKMFQKIDRLDWMIYILYRSFLRPTHI